MTLRKSTHRLFDTVGLLVAGIMLASSVVVSTVPIA